LLSLERDIFLFSENYNQSTNRRKKFEIYKYVSCVEKLKKWISLILHDLGWGVSGAPFKSDSGLESEFEIGRRNSRGNACPLVPRGFREPRASGARVEDRQFYEWGTTRGSNAAPIRSIPLPRGS